MLITNVKEARACLGKEVLWDETDHVYRYPCTGTLQEVEGYNLLINGDWKWRPKMINLRTKESEDGYTKQ